MAQPEAVLPHGSWAWVPLQVRRCSPGMQWTKRVHFRRAEPYSQWWKMVCWGLRACSQDRMWAVSHVKLRLGFSMQ